jgi:hypothetical protein
MRLPLRLYLPATCFAGMTRHCHPRAGGAPCRSTRKWIPAFAGMTWYGAGMTRHCHPRAGGGPCQCRGKWIPAFAGMTGVSWGTPLQTKICPIREWERIGPPLSSVMPRTPLARSGGLPSEPG